MPAAGYVAAARATGRRGATAPDRIAAALDAYATLKRRRGVVDFDDLLSMCAAELAADQHWADAVRFRYRHVLVDEAQDLNPVQQRLLDQLVTGRNDLYLVGDPAQSIYGFNGSDPALLLDVASRHPGIEVIALPVNHRCTPQVVAAGMAVLAAGGQERQATSARGDGPAVRVIGADDEDHEAALVIAVARSLDPGDLRAGSVAVLARTNAQLSRLSKALDAGRHPGAPPTARGRLTPRGGGADGDRPAVGQPAPGVGPRRPRRRRRQRRGGGGRTARRRVRARLPARPALR